MNKKIYEGTTIFKIPEPNMYDPTLLGDKNVLLCDLIQKLDGCEAVDFTIYNQHIRLSYHINPEGTTLWFGEDKRKRTGQIFLYGTEQQISDVEQRVLKEIEPYQNVKRPTLLSTRHVYGGSSEGLFERPKFKDFMDTLPEVTLVHEEVTDVRRDLQHLGYRTPENVMIWYLESFNGRPYISWRTVTVKLQGEEENMGRMEAIIKAEAEKYKK